MRLKDKIAIITGAASGIGRASAVVFANEGAKVAVVDVEESGGEQTVNKIRSDGRDCIFVKADVSDPNDIQNMINIAVEKWGKIDVVFNNAGIDNSVFVTDVTEDLWDRIIDVNLKGVFLGSKYGIKQMIKQKTKGSIVNTSSVLGLVTTPGECAYSASKAGVIGLTKALALDAGAFGIRVNCICPGFVLTNMTIPYLDKSNPELYLQKVGRLHALGRVGNPEEIAQAAAFLASDDASFVTGCAMTVDGGISIASSETVLTVLPPIASP